MWWKHLFVLFAVVSIFGCSDSSGKLKTVLILGQSNMVGWGNPATIPPKDIEKYESSKEQIYYFSYFDFKFKPPYFLKRKPSHYLDRFGITVGETFTPALSIQNKLTDVFPNEKILLLHYAIAGTSVYSSWHPDWTPDRAAVYARQVNMEPKHDLYGKTLEKIQQAETLAKEQGYKGLDILGVIWFQGEQDALLSKPANQYEENLTYLISKLREDLDNADLPFIFQQTNSTSLFYTDAIRQAQENVAANVANTKLIQTELAKLPTDYPKYDDELHYNTEGIIKLGEKAVEYLVESLN